MSRVHSPKARLFQIRANVLAATRCAIAGMLLGGCATMVRGGTQQVSLNSNPPGAEATIDDHLRVITPATVELTRSDDHQIVIRKPGYHDATVTLTSGASNLMLGNLIFGGLIGSNIDASTGSGRELSSGSVDVSLVPLGAPDTTGAPTRGPGTPPLAPSQVD